MAKEYNILLTSLGNIRGRLHHRYFYYEENGSIKYCDGISVGEAGAKYILSRDTMDEIIVIGSGATFNPGEEGVRIPLKTYSGYSANNIDTLSEYGFFLYRLLQFQSSLDFEAIDVLEQMEADRKAEIVAAYDAFCDEVIANHPDYVKAKMFHYIAQDEEILHQLYAKMPRLSNQEMLWFKRYVYTALPAEDRLISLDVNEDLLISFIPSDRSVGKSFATGDNIIKIIQSVYKGDDVKTNLYVDMQGLESSAGYSIVAVLSMLGNDPNINITIKEIITSHANESLFAGPIDNTEMNRYEINNLISGLDSFLRFGKVSSIENYWKNTHIENDHIDRLVTAMRWMDDGISLCNISDLEYGIALLKKVFKEPFMGELPEFESNVFQVFEKSIRLDYGELIDEEDLNSITLIKWAYNKKLYQQCLTIIESRIPDDIVSRGILYYIKEEGDKEAFMDALNQEYWNTPAKLRYSFEHLSHDYIKFHARSEVPSSFKSNDPSMNYMAYRLSKLDDPSVPTAPAHSLIDDHRTELEEMLYSYYTLGNVRNQVNHAARNADMEGEHKNDRLELVINTIEDFIAKYDAVLDIIKEKGLEDFRAEIVTEEEFAQYAKQHRTSRRSGSARRRDARSGFGGGGRGGYGRGRGYGGGGNGSSNASIPVPKLNAGDKLTITVEITNNGTTTVVSSQNEHAVQNDQKDQASGTAN